MADKFHFDLVSPEEALMSEEVEMVVVPGSEGDFGVLPGHAPLMSTMRPGVVEVHRPGQPIFQIYVRGGFADVTPAGLTILAEEAMPLAELDTSDIEAQIKDAEEDLTIARTDDERHVAEARISGLKNLLDAIQYHRATKH